MIDVSHLTFAYDGKTVLHDVSFSIAKNSVVALVGPNGAGKTTLMRCLVGLHEPLAGSIRMNGVDVLENPRGVRRVTGYLSDFFGLYDALTVRQCLLHMALCQQIPKAQAMARVEEIAALVGVVDYLDKSAATLSRGYRQRVGVGLAIIHRPQILILDEPASGMDPEARVGLSRLMLDLRAQGMTILVSSHILAELEDYCTDMLVIRDGKVSDYVSARSAAVETVAVSIRVPQMQDKYAKILAAQLNVTQVSMEGDMLHCLYAGGEDNLPQLLQAVIGAGIPVAQFDSRKKSLQRAYMELAEKEKQHGKGEVR